MKKKIILNYPHLFLLCITIVSAWLVLYFIRKDIYNYKMLATIGLLALAWLPIFLTSALKIKIPPVVVIFYYYFLVLSIFFGVILGFYLLVPWYDNFNHLVAGALLVLLGIFIAARLDNVGYLRFPALLTYGLFFAGFCAGAWEIVEHIIMRFLEPRAAAPADTIVDLIMNMLGAFAVVVLAVIDAKVYRHKHLEKLLKKFENQP